MTSHRADAATIIDEVERASEVPPLPGSVPEVNPEAVVLLALALGHALLAIEERLAELGASLRLLDPGRFDR